MQIAFFVFKNQSIKRVGRLFFYKKYLVFSKKVGVSCVKAEFAAQRGEPFCAGF